MVYFIANPLEQFEINNLMTINLFNNFDISITNMGLYIILVTIVVFLVSVYSLNNKKIIMNNWLMTYETIYSTIQNMVNTQLGKGEGEKYFPLIETLLIYILVLNLVGNIPYSFAVTSHLILTIGLSITILIGVTIIGFKIHKLKFFSLFCPAGTPLMLVPLLVLIEFVSYLARAVSLGLRLGANILSGHMLLVILGGFIYQIMMSGVLNAFLGLIPFVIVVGIAGLELAISAIQTYVFCILTSSYIKDGLHLH